MSEDHEVADAAATLLACIDAAEAVIASRDQTGTGMITGGATESAPPWNVLAANALMTLWAGVRDLEDWARELIGLGPARRGGSEGNTREAIRALVNLAPALPGEAPKQVARKLEGYCSPVLALPAVDKLPQWTVIMMPGGGHPPDCPYCAKPSLRAHEALGIIACLYPACPALAGGGRPHARISHEHGKLSWRWLDGRVQP